MLSVVSWLVYFIYFTRTNMYCSLLVCTSELSKPSHNDEESVLGSCAAIHERGEHCSVLCACVVLCAAISYLVL